MGCTRSSTRHPSTSRKRHGPSSSLNRPCDLLGTPAESSICGRRTSQSSASAKHVGEKTRAPVTDALRPSDVQDLGLNARPADPILADELLERRWEDLLLIPGSIVVGGDETDTHSDGRPPALGRWGLDLAGSCRSLCEIRFFTLPKDSRVDCIWTRARKRLSTAEEEAAGPRARSRSGQMRGSAGVPCGKTDPLGPGRPDVGGWNWL